MKEHALSALQSEKLDSSDFILICIDLLTEYGTDFRKIEIFEKIIRSYHVMDYNGAIEEIKKLITENSERISKDYPESYKIIVELLGSKKYELNDDPLENPSRRLYESECGREWYESVDGQYYESMRMLDLCLQEITPDTHKASSTFTSPEQISRVFIDLKDIAESNKEVMSIWEGLREQQPFKDRGPKRTDVPPTRHPGSLRSTHKVPRHHLEDKLSTNLPDVFPLTEKVGFSQMHPAGPFVNSISGTSYELIAILKYFVNKYKTLGVEKLDQHVNNIVTAFVAFMLKNGYHSMQEIVGVFEQKNVQEFIRKLGIKIDLSQDVIMNVGLFLSASDYSKVINQLATIHSQIKSSTSDSSLSSMDSADSGVVPDTVVFSKHDKKEKHQSVSDTKSHPVSDTKSDQTRMKK